MFSPLEWWEYFFKRGEKKIAERGRAFVPRKRLFQPANVAQAEPEITITARVYRDADDSWEDINVTKATIGKIKRNG